MRKFSLILLLAVAACTKPEDDYCASKGTPPNQLEQCHAYYFEQDAAFKSDLAVCSAQADQTYPQTLYSGWDTALVRRYHGGRFPHTEQVTVPPDAARNAQLDALRGRIIEPCMQKRGWNSGRSWQDGRKSAKGRKVSQMEPNGGGLPWNK